MAGYGTKFEPEAFGDDVLFEARKRRLQRGLSLEGNEGLDPFSRKTYRRLGAGDDDALLDEAARARRSRELGAMGLGETLPEAIPVTPDARERAHAILGEASQVQGGAGVPDGGLAEWHARFKMRQAMADRAREEDFWERANAARTRWARENRSFYQRKADAREEKMAFERAQAERADRRAALEEAMRQDTARRRLFAEMELEKAKREETALQWAHELDLERLKGGNAYRQAMDLEGLRGSNALEQENVKGAQSYRQAMGVATVDALGRESGAKINAEAKRYYADRMADAQGATQARKQIEMDEKKIEKIRERRDKYLNLAIRVAQGEIDKGAEQMIDIDDTLTLEEKQEKKRLLREANGKSPEMALFWLREAHRAGALINEPIEDYVLDGVLQDGAALVRGELPQVELPRLDAQGETYEGKPFELPKLDEMDVEEDEYWAGQMKPLSSYSPTTSTPASASTAERRWGI